MTETLLAPRPAHVPEDRVVDFDLYDFPMVGVDYQGSMKRALAEGHPELVWSPRNDGHWIMTSAEGIKTVLSDHDHFSSRFIVVPARESWNPPLVPLQIDPPDHAEYRALLQGALSPKAVGQLGEAARALSIELIESFIDRGHCEFISEFAQHLPIAIFMNIVGLPDSDRLMLTEMADVALRGETAEVRAKATLDIADYGMKKVLERRANPGDDLISRVAQAKVKGELIDNERLAGLVTLLLLGGLDTVASTLGFIAHFLAHHPEHRQKLIANPSLIPNAAEEFLRRFPIANLSRVVKADLDIYGVTLKAGDMILAPTALAGVDDRAFANPMTVDFERQRPGLNSTFGGGVHRCVGSMLARTEIIVFLEEWLKRIPDFEMAAHGDPKVSARSVATMTVLPLVWGNEKVRS